MVQAKGNDRSSLPPECPVCHHPQTKVQRRLSPTKNGSTMYVCTRVGQCSVGMSLNKMDTWVAV
jgi:hypothetical protein